MSRLMMIGTLLCAVSLVSCKNHESGSSEQVYPVMKVHYTTAEVNETYSASIRGRQDVEIYPQVSGIISQLCVEEGQKVKKGEVLFIIDQVPYQAALHTATANVHAAEAQVETARLDYNSKQELFRENVISDYDLSTAKNALAIAEAGLEQATAEEVNARNSLSYTEVKSPSDGIIGTLPYRSGALVGPSMQQPLTTVSDNELMYVYFSMTENQLRALIRQYGSPGATIRRMPPVNLQLNDGTMYGQPGRIETISGIINPQTGTASVRAVFPNENRLLFSGGIGNVVIPQRLDSIFLIPQSATYELQDKIFAYVVKEDSKVSATPLTVTRLNDGKQYIVLSGLKEGDLIVSEGTGLLQDDMLISVQENNKEPLKK